MGTPLSGENCPPFGASIPSPPPSIRVTSLKRLLEFKDPAGPAEQ